MRVVTIYAAPTGHKKTIDPWALPDLAVYKAHRTTKKLCEDTVEASNGSTSGLLGSNSWWNGVEPGTSAAWQCHLTLPVSLQK